MKNIFMLVSLLIFPCVGQTETSSEETPTLNTDSNSQEFQIASAYPGLETPAVSTATLPSKNWKGQLIYEIYVNEAELRDKSSDTTLLTYLEPKLSFLIAPKTYLDFSTPFDLNVVPDKSLRAHNVSEEANEGKIFEGVRLSNVWLGVSHVGGTTLSSDEIITWLRYYLPTSELSQELQQNGKLRLDVQVPWTWGKWQVLYYLNPRMTFSHNESTDRKSSLSFREYGYLIYNPTSSISMYTSYGHMLESNSQNYLYNEEVLHVFESGLTYIFSSTVNTTLYVTNSFNQSTEYVELFATNKNNFTLSTVIGF